jgi:hypothetical protein
MRKGENMVTLEKLRLREVALNSLLAKMGKDLRVKATVVRKNNVQNLVFVSSIRQVVQKRPLCPECPAMCPQSHHECSAR